MQRRCFEPTQSASNVEDQKDFEWKLFLLEGKCILEIFTKRILEAYLKTRRCYLLKTPHIWRSSLWMHQTLRLNVILPFQSSQTRSRMFVLQHGEVSTASISECDISLKAFTGSATADSLSASEKVFSVKDEMETPAGWTFYWAALPIAALILNNSYTVLLYVSSGLTSSQQRAFTGRHIWTSLRWGL